MDDPSIFLPPRFLGNCTVPIFTQTTNEQANLECKSTRRKHESETKKQNKHVNIPSKFGLCFLCVTQFLDNVFCGFTQSAYGALSFLL